MQPVIYIRCQDAALEKAFNAEKAVFTSLIRSGETHILSKGAKEPEGCVKSYVNEQLEIYVKVAGLLDMSLEIKRIEKRNGQLQGLLDGINKKMNMAGYLDKVPEKIRNENTEKANAYAREIDENKKAMERLSKLI